MDTFFVGINGYSVEKGLSSKVSRLEMRLNRLLRYYYKFINAPKIIVLWYCDIGIYDIIVITIYNFSVFISFRPFSLVSNKVSFITIYYYSDRTYTSIPESISESIPIIQMILNNCYRLNSKYTTLNRCT